MDLFAGCGGLSLGLELVGFRAVLAAELNSSARETYLLNRAHYLNEEAIVADVRDLASLSRRTLRSRLSLSSGEYPTLVAGGPPCQGFSGIGHRRTNWHVERSHIASNHLYKEMVEVIDRLQPSLFMFENVRGILSSRWERHGSRLVWDTVRHHFVSRLGKNYGIAFALIRSYNYGVPQNRPRVLMVGLHRDWWRAAGLGLEPQAANELTSRGTPVAEQVGLLPQPFPWERAPDLGDLLGDLVDPTWMPENQVAVTQYYPRAPLSALQAALRELPSTLRSNGRGHGRFLQVLTEQDYSSHSSRVIERFKLMLAGEQVPAGLRTKKFAQRLLPATWTAPPNITVASLPDDFVHFSQPRSLTVREWARLQGFPDWYDFRGPRTTGGSRRAGDIRSGDSVREAPRYTQIGNAVPVPLAAALGLHFRQLLKVRSTSHHGDLWNHAYSELLRGAFSRVTP